MGTLRTNRARAALRCYRLRRKDRKRSELILGRLDLHRVGSPVRRGGRLKRAWWWFFR